MKNASQRTATAVRVAGIGLLLGVAALALLDPGAASKANAGDLPEVAGLRRSDRFARAHGAFPGAQLTPMGVLEANGSPMELSFQTVDAPVDEVLDYYVKRFAAGGRHVDRNGDDRQAVASYYDETSGSLVSVQAIRSGSGSAARTLAIASIVDAPEGVRLATDAPAGLPMRDGTVTVMRVADPNGARVANNTVTQVVPGSPEEVAAFYKEKLSAEGWAVTSPSNAADSKAGVELIEATMPGEQLSISVAPLASEATESLVTTIREGDGSQR